MSLYIVPSQAIPGENVVYYGPLYFWFNYHGVTGSGVLPSNGFREYGFINGFMVEANLDAGQIAFLSGASGTYAFPDNMDVGIPPQDNLGTVMEGFNVPTNWTTPATTYREFVRRMNGCKEFVGKFAVLAGELGAPPNTHLFNLVTLDTRYRDFAPEVQLWFNATVDWFAAGTGFSSADIKPNDTIRMMLNRVAEFLEKPLQIGGVIY